MGFAQYGTGSENVGLGKCPTHTIPATVHPAPRPRDPGPRFDNWVRTIARSAALAQRARFVELGAWAGFGTKIPAAKPSVIDVPL